MSDKKIIITLSSSTMFILSELTIIQPINFTELTRGLQSMHCSLWSKSLKEYLENIYQLIHHL